ncbi:heat shock cognate 70 kDa protein-like protein [Tanacetum coccineum]|uniref:Heat shock cognate 70 kDa protein-like protein n=1 Tax=Tanacetum coccineum TaxID=301880 RepID=A0ABQ5FRG4_9ASTR
MARLKVACEKAKRDLSSTTFASIEIDCLHEGNDFSIKISRAKFEELNSTYFTKCVQLVEKCLFDGEMKKKDVDEVVVVGGSSRIPKVQRMVEEYFEGKTLYKTMNGDEAVASGAAIMAARLSGNDDNMKNDVVLQDVTPLSLGTAVQINGVRDNMSVVVPRNTSIPTSKKKTFTTRKSRTGDEVFPGDICRPGKPTKRQNSVRRGTNSDRLFSQSSKKFSRATCRPGKAALENKFEFDDDPGE